MNNMKCPFCQQELDTGSYYVRCHNPHCGITEEMEGTEEMWTALMHTRKALDIAVDALKEIDKTRCAVDVKLYAVNHKSLNTGNVFCWTTIDDLNNALEQITALEQRGVK